MSWWRADATGQAALLRDGQMSPAELRDATIGRLEALNPTLNAVIHKTYEHRTEDAAAGGPFAGVPIVLKDALCHTAGDPYHFGMTVLRDHAWRAEQDTYLASKMRRAGFLILGRTNTPELASAFTTEPRAYGATSNPWSLSLSVCGSSGGSAAAVSAGLVPVAHGNDMGGSIRVPASACGLVGLKTSRGRVSLGPDYGEYWGSLAHEGFLTRSVRDAAALVDVAKGYAPGDPYTPPGGGTPYADISPMRERLRVRLRTRLPGGGADSDPECVRAVELAGRLLAEQGHDVEYATIPALDDLTMLEPFRALFSVAISREVTRWEGRLRTTISEPDLEPRNWAAACYGGSITAADYVAAREALSRYARRLTGWWTDGHDILVTPTMGYLPPRRGSYDPQRDSVSQLGAFTRPFNVTGQPAISVPLHQTADGIPVGVQLIAPYGRDDWLLQLAAGLEAVCRWDTRFPPFAATLD